jgi:hypothetical protein
MTIDIANNHAPQLAPQLALKTVSTVLATTRLCLTRTTLAFRTTVPEIPVSPLCAEVLAVLHLHAAVLVALHVEVLVALAAVATPAP